MGTSQMANRRKKNESRLDGRLSQWSKPDIYLVAGARI